MTATQQPRKHSRKRGRGRGGSQPPAAPVVAIDDWSYRRLDWLRERFDIGDQIGSGCYKDVYRARDRTTGDDIALGIYVDPASEAVRFLERHEAARLCGDHPNIMRVIDAGVAIDDDDEPRAYAVMELVRNSVIADHAVLNHGGALPTTAVLRYYFGVLSGLQQFHNLGLVHGSPHPQNVMVDPDGHPVICDHDWVMQAGDTRIQPDQLVSIVGVHQTTPEQLRGLPHDERADLFVAGIGMYLVACGRYPYDPKHPVMHAHDSDLVARLDRLPETPRALNPQLPPRLSDLLLVLLTPDPDHRPQSAKESLEELTRIRFAFPGYEASVLVK